MKKTGIIFCPPLSKFETAPKDQSKCTAVECPDCNNLMWLSEKKVGLMKLMEINEVQIIYCCYDCFVIRARDRPELINDHGIIRI